MIMPFGTITAADQRLIEQATQCVAKIKQFKPHRGRELKIWGPADMLSASYVKLFEKVRENGETGGRKSDKEQQEVNKEFVKAYPKGCHKRKSISTTEQNILVTKPRSSADDAPSPKLTARSSATDAPTPMTTPRASTDDEPKPKWKAPMPAKAQMPKKEEGGNTQPQSKPTIRLDLVEEITKMLEE